MIDRLPSLKDKFAGLEEERLKAEEAAELARVEAEKLKVEKIKKPRKKK